MNNPTNSKRYCAVRSCVNNRGTNDPKMHMFKIPKNRDSAEKWLSFLGIDSNMCGFFGYICNQHVKDEYMSKNKCRLKVIASPATVSGRQNGQNDQHIENDIAAITNSFASMTPLDPTLSASSSTIARVENVENECHKCIEKDNRITSLEAEISALKQKLNGANKKISYLKKTKNNLDTAFTDLKKQNVINEEQCKLLEVIYRFFHYSFSV